MVYEIVTDTTILARIRLTIVHIQLTVLPLEATRTLTGIASNEIATGGTILAGIGFTFVDFDGAVGAGVALHAMAAMRVAKVFARSVVAQGFTFQT